MIQFDVVVSGRLRNPCNPGLRPKARLGDVDLAVLAALQLCVRQEREKEQIGNGNTFGSTH